jgi:protein-tyrosine phosphatase
MDQNYHSLHENRIFMGGAKDVEAMEKNEGIDVVVDLRGEATECAFPESKAKWIKIPLGDNSSENEHLLFKQAIDEVVNAYKSDKKVAFHCGGGKGRTGTVAAGTLLALGMAKDIEEAEATAKSIRPNIDIKPLQKEALKKLFPY